jgi:hypothetical protein
MFLYAKKYYDEDFETVSEIIDVRNKPPIKEEYREGFDEYFNKIVDLLKNEGKNGLAKIQTQKGVHPQVVVNNMINDDNYFLTNLDLWILFKKFNISFVFISSFVIKNMEEEHKYKFVGNYVDENIVFIVSPGLAESKVPTYKFITKEPETQNVFISPDDLNCELIDESLDFIEFVENYKITSKNEYKKQKPKKFILIDEIKPKQKKMKLIE